MDKQSKIKEVTKGMYVAEVSKIEISTISKPLLAGKLDTALNSKRFRLACLYL